MKINIVIPTYNEAENIKELIPAVFKVFNENNLDGCITVVDDNSPDGTANVVQSLQEKEKYPVTLIERPNKSGLGTAYIAGFKRAIEDGADVIFEMDADFSHDPKYIPEFIRKIEDGADLVIGSRYMKGGKRKNCPIRAVIIGHGANILIKLIDNLPVTDVTTGYRAYKKEVLGKINLDNIKSQGYEFQLEMIYKTHRLGYRIDGIPIIFTSRTVGESKLSREEIKNFFIRAFELRRGKI